MSDRQRASYVGVPEIFELNAACVLINKAFAHPPHHAMCYHVGSSLERRDYRDVDVRLIMEDEQFCELFGGKPPIMKCPKDEAHVIEGNSPFCYQCARAAGEQPTRTKILQHFWVMEMNPLWALMSVSISGWLRQRTGLPIDFQIQPRTFANDRFEGPRHALGMYVARGE